MVTHTRLGDDCSPHARPTASGTLFLTSEHRGLQLVHKIGYILSNVHA